MQWMSEPQNPWFARAIVNRVWAGYFHVGIIDPPDDLNPANPPSNPELLDWLCDFVENKYDMKWLHRQIATSDTYQRSWKPNATNREDRRNFSRAVPRRLPAEMVYDSVKQALAERISSTRSVPIYLDVRLGTFPCVWPEHTPCKFSASQIGRSIAIVNAAISQLCCNQFFCRMIRLLINSSKKAVGCARFAADTESTLNRERLVETAWLRTVSRPPTSDESARAITTWQVARPPPTVYGICSGR